MGCALLDLLTLSRGRRLRELLDGAGVDYPHLIHVGAGWAFAKLRLRPWRGLRAGDPLLRWLAWDGFGFYQGFFDSDRVVAGQRIERGLDPRQRAVRDQGLGRCLWFHECADPEALGLRVAEFPQGRRADLWSGIGLAAVYAGGADQDELRALAEVAGGYRAHLAQGAAFACGARVRARTPLPEHCGPGALALAGVPPRTAADWTDTAQADLGPDPRTSQHYEEWRAGIRGLWTTYHNSPPAGARADDSAPHGSTPDAASAHSSAHGSAHPPTRQPPRHLTATEPGEAVEAVEPGEAAPFSRRGR
ncbi:enediyne biosynthesis protein [Streptomyces alanosinicus]|uniref:Enediyne biosynthesis protein n=2 Tax=Streptomyces alanosinicus TaxID=68171 RepID=A0A918YBY6_9ACTN|nr:enediyne biosynthesis protein [Streptomyces alanosinicus]